MNDISERHDQLRTPPARFETQRLILRCAAHSDAEALFTAYTGREAAARFLQREAHRSVAQTEEVLASWGEESWAANGKFAWSIVLKDSNLPFGLFLLSLDGNTAEIHFGISPDNWGHGFAAEAGQAIMEWIDMQTELSSVSTICDVEHFASLRVLEKLGFRQEGLLPQHLFFPSMGAKRDCWLYLWQGRQPRS